MPPPLYHFTKLSYLLHILYTKKLTFTNPEEWDDENDKCSINKYKELKDIKTLLALCFTAEKESYHFWKICGTEGVRIEFNTVNLKQVLDKHEINLQCVVYKGLDELQKDAKSDPNIKTQLPFLKRKHGYAYEREWRAIYK